MESFRILNDEKVKMESIGEEAFADLVDACNKVNARVCSFVYMG